MPHKLVNLIEQYHNNHQVFIESGSFNGEGIKAALVSQKFKLIYSIELSPIYHNKCKQLYKNENNIKLIFGDSGIEIKNILQNINESCFFWLDGHYSAGDTACAQNYCSPIVKELEHIKNHHINSHTIIIDDIRCFNQESIDENNKINGKCGYILKDNLSKILLSINSDYEILYVSDVCIARLPLQ